MVLHSRAQEPPCPPSPSGAGVGPPSSTLGRQKGSRRRGSRSHIPVGDGLGDVPGCVQIITGLDQDFHELADISIAMFESSCSPKRALGSWRVGEAQQRVITQPRSPLPASRAAPAPQELSQPQRKLELELEQGSDPEHPPFLCTGALTLLHKLLTCLFCLLRLRVR